MERFCGCLVQSKAGHDAGTIYLVLREEGAFVWLADGGSKSVSKPKKKNIRHIVRLKYDNAELKRQLQSGELPEDPKLRRLIKEYKKESSV